MQFPDFMVDGQYDPSILEEFVIANTPDAEQREFFLMGFPALMQILDTSMVVVATCQGTLMGPNGGPLPDGRLFAEAYEIRFMVSENCNPGFRFILNENHSQINVIVPIDPSSPLEDVKPRLLN